MLPVLAFEFLEIALIKRERDAGTGADLPRILNGNRSSKRRRYLPTRPGKLMILNFDVFFPFSPLFFIALYLSELVLAPPPPPFSSSTSRLPPPSARRFFSVIALFYN